MSLVILLMILMTLSAHDLGDTAHGDTALFMNVVTLLMIPVTLLMLLVTLLMILATLLMILVTLIIITIRMITPSSITNMRTIIITIPS